MRLLRCCGLVVPVTGLGRKSYSRNLDSCTGEMSISVEVRLLSGRTAIVKADLDEEVETLNIRAQTALGVGKGRLVDSFGSLLNASALVSESKIKSGDSLSLQIKRVQLQGSGNSFAAILGDGSVVTWGHAGLGGDSSSVQDQLRNVRQIYAAQSAFAALLADGSVVTWGSAVWGGDSSAVQDQLKNVQQIQGSWGDLRPFLAMVLS